MQCDTCTSGLLCTAPISARPAPHSSRKAHDYTTTRRVPITGETPCTQCRGSLFCLVTWERTGTCHSLRACLVPEHCLVTMSVHPTQLNQMLEDANLCRHPPHKKPTKAKEMQTHDLVTKTGSHMLKPCRQYRPQTAQTKIKECTLEKPNSSTGASNISAALWWPKKETGSAFPSCQAGSTGSLLTALVVGGARAGQVRGCWLVGQSPAGCSYGGTE